MGSRLVLQAHPRSRGEHRGRPRGLTEGCGSSPLARGARPEGCAPDRGLRLIPARAGSTPADLSTMPWPDGSSPLARGAQADAVGGRPRRRLIPARAGSTPPTGGAHACHWAHPRSRGEHPTTGRHRYTVTGSSPLARGARGNVGRPRTLARLIPARAGSTTRRARWSRRPPAHPRSRGEHYSLPSTTTRPSGSSPLARGAPVCQHCCERVDRLIPARAGSTASTSSATTSPRAHPRSRGEHRFGLARIT